MKMWCHNWKTYHSFSKVSRIPHIINRVAIWVRVFMQYKQTKVPPLLQFKSHNIIEVRNYKIPG